MGLFSLILSLTTYADIFIEPIKTSDIEKENTANEPELVEDIGNHSIKLDFDEIKKQSNVITDDQLIPIESDDKLTTITDRSDTTITIKQGENHVIERIEDGKKRTEIGIVQGSIITIQSGQEAKAVSNVGTIR